MAHAITRSISMPVCSTSISLPLNRSPPSPPPNRTALTGTNLSQIPALAIASQWWQQPKREAAGLIDLLPKLALAPPGTCFPVPCLCISNIYFSNHLTKTFLICIRVPIQFNSIPFLPNSSRFNSDHILIETSIY